MRTVVLSLAALAASAAAADAQYVMRRGVVYGPTYPGYYVAPNYVAPHYVVPAAAAIDPFAVPPPLVPATHAVVFPPAPVVGYGYYPAYRPAYLGWRWR